MWKIISLIFILTLPFVIADGFGDCPFGDYGFGDGCPVSPPPKVEEPAGVGGTVREDARPADAVSLRIGEPPQCSEGNQYFDGACYPCPVNGTLYKYTDGKVGCVICNDGAEYDGKGGCQKVVIPQPIQTTAVNQTGIMELSSKISPKNPYVGFALLTIPTMGLLYWLYTRFTYAKKYEKLKKREEEGINKEEETEEKES